MNVAATGLPATSPLTGGLAPDPLLAWRADAADGQPQPTFRLATALLAHGRPEEACATFRAAAVAGHDGAQVEHARMLLHGIGTAADPELAVEWLLRAERAGNPVAGYHLALAALGDSLLPRDGRINERILAAVQHDYLPAMRAAAIHFGRKPEPSDQARCVNLLQRASGRGDAIATQLLAERLQRGEGCEPQPALAADVRKRIVQHVERRLPPIPAWSATTRATTTLMPAGTLAFEEALIAPPALALAQRPRLAQIDGLLSSDECRLLVASALAQPDSLPPDNDAVASVPARYDLAAGLDAALAPMADDFALRLIELRLAQAAHCELTHAEPLVVERFTPGQQSRAHRDNLPPDQLDGGLPGAGDRLRTIGVYLNDAIAGGETEFPFAQHALVPRAGRAIVFDNLHADGSPDTYALHAELPVRIGEKWLATLWLRQRHLRAF